MRTAEEKYLIANSKKAIETQEGIFIPLEEVREMLEGYKKESVNIVLLEVVRKIENLKLLIDKEHYIISSSMNLGVDKAKNIVLTSQIKKI